MQKRVVGKEVEWKDRFVTLTSEKIYIRNVEGGDIRDVLPLLHITHVKQMAQDAHAASILRYLAAHTEYVLSM